MLNVEKAWESKLKETKRTMEEQIAKERKLAKEREEIPHLWNLNIDPALTGKIVYYIKPGCFTSVGNKRAVNPSTIELHGPSIAQEHCMIQNKNTKITIMPLNGQIRVNGMIITGQTTLKHQDRQVCKALLSLS
ncbi:kinesin-like protein unc-104 [Mercenaria mercenaria]|uniref:kinesin-like protein unc-104 n=1 Tax=Mercenaria mercenaria TaxID=6596 RepID=UPI00234FB1DC|nr:kinesin-like protein unc-104 [Mercenaria mercenaria]